MALDRQSIEKKDFPIGRRGYDPEAVDVHLSSLADQIESSGGSTESLAASAGEQVRAIVEVAETTAAQIRTEADRQAKKLLADARKEVRTARDAAAVEAGEHVAKISQSAASMLERIDAMEQEANSLLASLRTGADRLGADLRLLEGNLADIKAAIAPEEPEEDQDPELLVAAVVVEEEEELDADDEPEAVAAPAAEAPTAVAEAIPAAEPAPEGEGAGDVDDIEGARLIALNMALNGNSREDIDRYLDENFDLANRDALLDEVYASVEG